MEWDRFSRKLCWDGRQTVKKEKEDQDFHGVKLWMETLTNIQMNVNAAEDVAQYSK